MPTDRDYDRAYYAEFREAILAKKRAHYARNRDRIVERQRAYRREHATAINLSKRLAIPTGKARAMIEARA